MKMQTQRFHKSVCSCVNVLLLLGAAPRAAIDAFSVKPNIIGFRHQRKRTLVSNAAVLFSTNVSHVTTDKPPNVNSMSKIEASGVKRFTVGYNKLCKNCPTRLQPRVDTLTEMILGLPERERDELMQNVAKRLLEAPNREEENPKIVSSVGVYEIQTSGIEVMKPKKPKIKQEKIKALSAQKSVQDPTNKSKLLRKMEKSRIKFECNKNKVARVKRLLEVTNMLLSRHSAEPTIGTADNGWYHEICLLQQQSRDELKMERLKFVAQRAKYEQKVAKQRLKLYGASMALTDVNNKEYERVMLPYCG